MYMLLALNKKLLKVFTNIHWVKSYLYAYILTLKFLQSIWQAGTLICSSIHSRPPVQWSAAWPPRPDVAATLTSGSSSVRWKKPLRARTGCATAATTMEALFRWTTALAIESIVDEGDLLTHPMHAYLVPDKQPVDRWLTNFPHLHCWWPKSHVLLK